MQASLQSTQLPQEFLALSRCYHELKEDSARIQAMRSRLFSVYLQKKPDCFQEVVLPKVENAVMRAVTNTNLDSKGKAATFIMLNKIFKAMPGPDLMQIQTKLKGDVHVRALEVFNNTALYRHINMDCAAFQACFVPKTLSSAEGLELLLAVAFDHLWKVRSPSVAQLLAHREDKTIDPLLAECIDRNHKKDLAITIPAGNFVDAYALFIDSLHHCVTAPSPESAAMRAKDEWQKCHALACEFAASSFAQALFTANCEFEALYEIARRTKREACEASETSEALPVISEGHLEPKHARACGQKPTSVA